MSKNETPKELQLSLEIYKKELGRIKGLTPETEQELIKRYREGDKAAGDKVVVSNLKFAYFITKPYKSEYDAENRRIEE